MRTKTIAIYISLFVSLLVLSSCNKGNRAISKWATIMEIEYWKMTPEELSKIICSNTWTAYEIQGKEETVYIGKIDNHPEAMRYTVNKETGLVDSVTFFAIGFSKDVEEQINLSLSELDGNTYDPLLASFILDENDPYYVSSFFLEVRQAFQACGAELPENQAGFSSDSIEGIQNIIAPYEAGLGKVEFAEGYYRFPETAYGVSYATIITTDGTAYPRKKVLFQVFLCSGDYTDHFGEKPQNSGYQMSKDKPIVVGSAP